MPLEIRCIAAPASVLSDNSDDPHFVIRDVNHSEYRLFISPVQWIEIDIYVARRDFLAVSTREEARSFLLRYGGFRSRHGDDDEETDVLRWSHFRDWQRCVREMLIGGPLPNDLLNYPDQYSWVDHITPDESISRYLQDATARVLPTQPHSSISIGPLNNGKLSGSAHGRPLKAEITLFSVLQGLLASVFFDGLNGLEHRLCSLPDCGQLYEVTSKHAREYCSQSCAHKASVRRRRDAAAKSKTRAGKKAHKRR